MFKRFNSNTDVSTSTPVKSSIQRSMKQQLIQQHTNITEDIIDLLIPKKAILIQYKITSHLILYCMKQQQQSISTNEPSSNDHNHHDHDDLTNIITTTPSNIPILFQHRDQPILPTLKFILPYCMNNNHNNSMNPPNSLFTCVMVDAGAIPYIIGGANIMCPGLTKIPGSYMPPDQSIITTTNSNDTTNTPTIIPGLQKGQGVVIYAEHKVYPIAIGVMTMSSIDIRRMNKGIACEVVHYLGDGLYQTNEI